MAPSTEATAARAALRQRLLALLHASDLDGALQAGLMDYAPGDDDGDAPIAETQARLRSAWAARERHRARESRLAGRAAERAARRSATRPAATTSDSPGAQASVAVPPAAGAPGAAGPALPAAAAAALARARARAAGKPVE